MYLLNNNDLTVSEVEMTTFRSINWREVDVEELLRKNIELICDEDESFLIVGKQIRNSAGGQSDLTAIDNHGNLVLIEIKRDRNDICQRREAFEFQAIRYAASYATIRTKEELIDKIYAQYVERFRNEFLFTPETTSREVAQRELKEFFQQNGIREFNRTQRIVLVASEFDSQTLSAVAWLINRNVDISCISLTPFVCPDDNDRRIFLKVKKVLPLPEYEDFLVDFAPGSQRPRSNRPMQPITRRSLPKIREMLEWGIVQAGDELHAKDFPEKRAILLSNGNVKPLNSENTVSLQHWLKEVYSWGSVATYAFTVASSCGKTLSALRAEYLSTQENATE